MTANEKGCERHFSDKFDAEWALCYQKFIIQKVTHKRRSLNALVETVFIPDDE